MVHGFMASMESWTQCTTWSLRTLWIAIFRKNKRLSNICSGCRESVPFTRNPWNPMIPWTSRRPCTHGIHGCHSGVAEGWFSVVSDLRQFTFGSWSVVCGRFGVGLVWWWCGLRLLPAAMVGRFAVGLGSVWQDVRLFAFGRGLVLNQIWSCLDNCCF